MHALLQMPRTCTQRLNRNSPWPTSSLARPAKPPAHPWETPVCASPGNPPSVRHRRTQEHLHIPADHTEPPRPVDRQHTSVLLRQIPSRCTSDPSLPSKHSGLSAPKRSAGHPHRTHGSETAHPLSRRGMATGSSPMGRPAPDAASPLARSVGAKLGEAEHQLILHKLTHKHPCGHPQNLRLHIVRQKMWRQKMWDSTRPSLHPTRPRNYISPFRTTGGAAELGGSWPSWPLPRHCPTRWRCPAAARPPPQTWRRGAGRCSRRCPGCPWRGASWLPPMQPLRHHPEAHPNPSSKRHSQKGKPSSMCCSAPSHCSHTT